MSKYPVRYVSGSKKAELNIEDMATPHLMNAWRKVEKEYGRDGGQAEMYVLRVSMEKELRLRGCIYDSETERWIVPPKPEEATS